MRVTRVLYTAGQLVISIGLLLLLPLICSLIYQEGDHLPFIWTMLIAFVGGGFLILVCRDAKKQTMRQRECFFLVSLIWIILTLIGSLPYWFGGFLPDFWSCLFESASGFTTTGATVVNDIEALPHGILFYRSLTNWIGGAGIILCFVAILNRSPSRSEDVGVYKAEYSGGALSERISPRIRDNARIIFIIYCILTLVFIIGYKLAGMSLFDAINHSFSAAATGGFSTKNASIGAFNSPLIEWLSIIFVFLGGVNLSLFYFLFVRRRFRMVFGDDELRFYAFAAIAISLMIFISLQIHGYYAEEGWIYSLRQSLFQCISLITTCGFCTVDYDLWPSFARILLLLVLFMGACAGSTSSSIKGSRWIIALRSSKTEMERKYHPQMMSRLEYNGKPLQEPVVRSIVHYFYLYFLIFLLGAGLIAASSEPMVESFFGSAACIGNVGPAAGALGPSGTFAHVDPFCKVVMSLLMIAGRLEIYPLIVLFLPGIWKK